MKRTALFGRGQPGYFEPSAAEIEEIENRLEAMLLAASASKDHIRGSLVISFLVTVCLNQPDPMARLMSIARATAQCLDEARGPVGHA
jgi:hypothetical protein